MDAHRTTACYGKIFSFALAFGLALLVQTPHQGVYEAAETQSQQYEYCDNHSGFVLSNSDNNLTCSPAIFTFFNLLSFVQNSPQPATEAVATWMAS